MPTMVRVLSRPHRLIAAGFLLGIGSGLAPGAGAQAPHGSTFFGLENDENVGAALAPAGDLDGDGVPDIVAGATDAGAGGFLRGRLYALSGADPTHILWVFDGRTDFEMSGFALAALSDGDGDGVAEIVVSAPGYTGPGGASQGIVRLLSGADGTLIDAFTVDEAGQLLGAALAAAGDRDGDGLVDLLVGAPRAAAGGSERGCALLLHVGAAGFSAGFQIEGAQDGEHLGSALAWLPDLDGDLVEELAVGAPDFDGGELNCGRTWVVSGADLSTLGELFGSEKNEQLGARLQPILDPDGSGDTRLLVSQTGKNDLEGGAQIVDPIAGTVLRAYGGDSNTLLLGESLSVVGDQDGDGVPDFLIGTSFADDPGGGFLNGVVDLVSSAGDGIPGGTSSKLFREYGADADRRGTVAGLGDLDGDGCSDYGFGAIDAIDPGNGAQPGSVCALRGRIPRLRTDAGHYVDFDPIAVQGLSYADSPVLLMAGTSLSADPCFRISFAQPYLLVGGFATDADGALTVDSTIPDLAGTPLTLYLQIYVPHPGAKKKGALFSEVASFSVN